MACTVVISYCICAICVSMTFMGVTSTFIDIYKKIISIYFLLCSVQNLYHSFKKHVKQLQNFATETFVDLEISKADIFLSTLLFARGATLKPTRQHARDSHIQHACQKYFNTVKNKLDYINGGKNPLIPTISVMCRTTCLKENQPVQFVPFPSKPSSQIHS